MDRFLDGFSQFLDDLKPSRIPDFFVVVFEIELSDFITIQLNYVT
jgi:hypothetical protein